MPEIQVILPLSILDGVKDLTPEGIIEFLNGVAKSHLVIAKANTRIMVLENMINMIGKNLEACWEQPDIWKRAQDMRRMINELKNFEAKDISE